MAKLNPRKTRSVILTRDLISFAARLGDGNVSAGIRRALGSYIKGGYKSNTAGTFDATVAAVQNYFACQSRRLPLAQLADKKAKFEAAFSELLVAHRDSGARGLEETEDELLGQILKAAMQDKPKRRRVAELSTGDIGIACGVGLTNSEMEKVKAIGHGNMSHGVRHALETIRTDM